MNDGMLNHRMHRQGAGQGVVCHPLCKMESVWPPWSYSCSAKQEDRAIVGEAREVHGVRIRLLALGWASAV
jgi:hypothetical protein